MNHVILGNGPAGVIAAEHLKAFQPGASVTLVGDEPEPPYSRMAIPYLLMGNIGEAGTHLRKAPGHFEALGIRPVRARATKVDTQARTVSLDSGERLPWDRLLVATGSRPITPPIPGIDSPGVHPCWTLADARAIQRLAKPGARVLQMGAGFIGCIILEALAARGVKLSVVEMGNRMVPRMMTERAGAMIKRWVESKGVAVYTSTRVEAIEPAAGALKVKLSGGPSLEVDLVISATGVRPGLGFLQGSGIATDSGILVDAAMQSSVPGIYAAGDCAQADEFNTGARIVNAIQPNAADQALTAARAMTGQSARSQGTMAINVLDTLGLISTSFGQWMGVEGGAHAELADEERYRYLSLEFRDDVLVGATSLGLTQHVGVLRGLIQGRVRLGPWKEALMRDPTRVMEAYLATAQDQERREKKSRAA